SGPKPAPRGSRPPPPASRLAPRAPRAPRASRLELHIISKMGVEEHRKTAVAGVRCCVLTISDTRAPETDVSGRTLVELLEAAGHVVAKRQILRDEPKDVHEAVLGQVGGVDAII